LVLFAMVCARVTDADVCMCAQEQVRRLTAENEALRRQLQEQEQRLHHDASKEVRNVCLFFITRSTANLSPLSTPAASNPAPLSRHTLALAECARPESLCCFS
jgi:hypothetical protein